MKPIGKVIAAPFKALGLIPKTPKLPAPAATLLQPTAVRDTARQALERSDEIRRRRGSAADIITGSDGAEAGPVSAKDLLGS